MVNRMNYYISNPHPDELYHYGVKGMKWGIRRAEKYEAKSRKWADKEAKARTDFGRNRAGTKRISYKYAAIGERAAASASDKKSRRQQKYGAEATVRSNEALSEMHAMRASRAKNEKKRTRYASQAYNASSMAQHYRKVSKHSKSTIKRTLYSSKHIMKTPMKTLKGKNTTYGKELTKIMLASAAVSAIQIAATI